MKMLSDRILLEKLDVKTDDIEQYSRRSCIRIHGIELDENTSSENVDKILSDCFKKSKGSL